MAKKKVKKVSELRKAYKKEERRIKQFIRRAEKRGYDVQYRLPSEPKRVTKQRVEKLRKLTATELYKKSKFVDTETGEIITGTEGRKLERKRSAEKGRKTRELNKQAEKSFWTTELEQRIPKGVVIATGEDIYDNIYDNFISRLKRNPDTEQYTFNGKRYKRRRHLIEHEKDVKSELSNLFEMALAKYGKKKLGWLLQDYQEDMDGFLDIIEHASDDTQIDYGFLGVSRIINQIVNGNDQESFSKSEELLNQEVEYYEEW